MFKKLFGMVFVAVCLAVGVYGQGGDKPAGGDKAANTSSTQRFTPSPSQVKQGQQLLKDKKYYDGDATGKYNDETRAAIRKYQKDNGLTVSGNFNKATIEKMGIALTDKQSGGAEASTKTSSKTEAKSTSNGSTASSDADKPKRAAPFKANKEQITAAQKLLKQQSMFSGEESGKFSDEFREGLRKFQEAKGMKVTGTLNAATLDKMGIALTDAQKKNAGE
jgi:peptidoglycan hydrolase-like protein with peptidoglycan-binding domain